MSRNTTKANEATATAPAAPVLQKVTLLKPHTHEGQEYGEGDDISVDAPTRQWLIENKVIEGDAPAAADQETAQ